MVGLATAAPLIMGGRKKCPVENLCSILHTSVYVCKYVFVYTFMYLCNFGYVMLGGPTY